MTDTRTEPSTAEVARGAAQDTAQEATEQAKEVVSVASDQIASVGSEAIGHARTVVDSATSDVRDQLEQRLRTLSEQARTTAEELQALVEGRPEDAGRTKDLAQTASARIEKVADRVDELGVQGVVEEVTDLARRRPVLFLAGAAAAGVLVGRMARAGKEAQGSSSDATPNGISAPAAPTPAPMPAPTSTPTPTPMPASASAPLPLAGV